MYFFKKYKEMIFVIVIAVILIVTIGLTSRRSEPMSKFENLLGGVLTPLNKVTNSIMHGISGIITSVSDTINAKEENIILKKEIEKLESENRDLRNIIGKSDYLLKEQKLLETTKYNIVKAEVIGREPENWFDVFTLDKGENDGLEIGDTVIDAVEIDNNVYQEGLVGRIVDIGDNWSKVVSITNEKNSVAFKIIRTQDGGIIAGSSDNIIEGLLFDYEADVIIGDLVYTSGLGEVYQKDIFIGEVSDIIDNQEELTKKIIIKPAVNFKKLYNVYVIK
ncbi:rod shape-determining protein MreC [Soehngenia longivitae]|uniref:Cell shape-determining protein MreC n=1 Tax=Soehngenia longivitae TaxID=2562294 RepID=A0A4Z0D3T0_9FIRM|nr:rod shape-determining protein MreC [Soehngenia longivitae]TFZ40015.1 rod shape-determining protein MreC [Soehngenia longivitae]